MRLLPATSTSRLALPMPRRLNLLKNLAANLIVREQIVTTPARAAAVRPIVDMLIRNAKSGVHSADGDKPATSLMEETRRWLVVSHICP